MFSIPTIPTDNLYKFCFVSGVLLLLLSALIQYNSNALQIKSETFSIQLKLEEQRDSVIRARKIAKDSIQRKGVWQLTSQEERALVLGTDSIINRGIPHIQDVSTVITYTKYYFITSTIGIILIYIGGVNWHKKIQKPQDELQVIQLKSAKIELEVAQLNLQKLQTSLKLDAQDKLNGPDENLNP